MFPSLRILLLFFVAIFSCACATSPSGDDDFIVHGEEPEGPGVFSGEDGKFILFGDSAPTTDEDKSPAVEMSAKEWEEFSAFKRWLKARQERDASYQEFLQWRQFEAYKNWQDSQ